MPRRHRAPRDKVVKQRDTRARTCAKYLREAGSIPAAMKLAKGRGFNVNTSAWVAALGKLIIGKM